MWLPGRSKTMCCTLFSTSPNANSRSMSVNLGPVGPALRISGLKLQSGNGLDHNPRCLRRDISSYVFMGRTKTSDVTGLIKNYTEICPFQDTMQGNSPQAILVSTAEAITRLAVIWMVYVSLNHGSVFEANQ